MFKKLVRIFHHIQLVAILRGKIFMQSQKGVTAIEYALIAVAISSMLFIVLGSGGEDGLISKIKESFRSIQDGLSISKSQGNK
ncbi:Flp family type IVb pilin [Helicobacter cappadocius]|uniref:Flp family type IVb pilin n=1 Tax=Helicobacter cappadocius TaxID=3063998 RepID=A0AA90TBF5_9HELI|nr:MULTISPECIES: Flp family type IVb pilin [unclassified Helicobacter]MDO7253128.1 Flp family type IVb pilin [Helicobacter sp. faydin-H75]MDP2538746.1 Flp family type IVb pilin [Helicobacter sp. faydin-H76]